MNEKMKKLSLMIVRIMLVLSIVMSQSIVAYADEDTKTDTTTTTTTTTNSTSSLEKSINDGINKIGLFIMGIATGIAAVMSTIVFLSNMVSDDKEVGANKKKLKIIWLSWLAIMCMGLIVTFANSIVPSGAAQFKQP